MILNIGCGDDTREYGIDVQRTSACQMVADARYLPFRDGVIMGVFCYETLEHISDFMRVISEMYRVLRHGGLVFVSVPNILFYRAYMLFFLKNKDVVTPEHIHAFRNGELQNAFSLFDCCEVWYDTTHYHTVKWYERFLPARLQHRSLFAIFRKWLHDRKNN